MSRSCGTCSACCRWPEIPSISKPRLKACNKLEACGNGCKVYGLRPKECKEFRCAWIEGAGEARDVPDTSGVLLFRRGSQFGEVLIAADLPELGTFRSKKKAIKRIVRDTELTALLVDRENPEKIVLVCSPEGAEVSPLLKPLEVV
tara:strand:- start:9526 stop:9963 length:438 start_codon:yes stop_codon:yes gene_type:complete